VNVNEAKSILLPYRPGTADLQDTQIAEALALAKCDPELARWLAAHVASQAVLRAKFRQIIPPAGLKEQIVAEYAAGRRQMGAGRLLWVSAAVLVLLIGSLAVLWHPQPQPAPESALAVYQSQMVRMALGGYEMDFKTNDLALIRANLAQRHAPADFALPEPLLQRTVLTGCAATVWRGARISLVCFRTGKPLPRGVSSDLWLFVVDRTAITNTPLSRTPQIAKVNRLITATWTDGSKLYFLGVEGQEADIQRYL
jgi:hypothetical protein